MTVAPTARPPSRRRARRYLPPQHGAWAMLLLPYAVGVAGAGPVWLDVPLLVAWVGGYLLSYYVLLAIKTRRPERVAGPLRLYAALCLPAATLVAVRAPAVWAFAPPIGALLAVNARYARRHADRALPAGLASAASSCLIVPVTATVAGQPVERSVLPGLVLLAYLAGSVLYVKTVIRERGDRRYLVASVSVHALAAAALVPVSWPLAALFGWFTIRAAWLPARAPTPKQVGLTEVVHSLLLLVMVPVLVR
ncbi:MAG TPA: YwiC-like family protein [Kineosporiaceae bacterium]